MNIRFLETVIWLARLRTIKATADRLSITHAAISSRIAAIEQDLGVRLFTREDNGFEPTVNGFRFIEEATRIVESYQKLRRVMLDPARLRGNLRIGMVSTMIPTVFPLLAKTLREEFPHVSMSISTELSDRLIKDLRAGKLDLVLTSSWPSTSEFEAISLCHFTMAPVASPCLNVDSSRPATPQELAKYPVIGYQAGTESQMRVEEYFNDLPHKPEFHAGNSLPSNIQMVKAGIGISFVPVAAVLDEIAQGILVRVQTTKRYVNVQYAACFEKEVDMDFKTDGGIDLKRAIATIARQSADLFCRSVNPDYAWQDNPHHLANQI